MAFVNAFLHAGNEHREVSIGGRRANDSTHGWFNCMTADGQRGMRVSAEVTGSTNYKDRCKNGDDRTAIFTIELPKPSDHVKVRIWGSGAGMAKLAQMGAMLCGIKAAQELVAGEVEQSKATLSAARNIIADLETHMEDLPDVTLPGDISLRHALACVEFVRRLREQGESEN